MATATKDIDQTKSINRPKPLAAPDSDFYELAETLGGSGAAGGLTATAKREGDISKNIESLHASGALGMPIERAKAS